MNECEQADICAVGTYCKNTEGAYTCEKCDRACEQGCTDHNRLSCVACANGYEMKEDEGCMDVDQCANGEVTCKNGQVCVNTDGDDMCQGGCSKSLNVCLLFETSTLCTS